MLHEVLHPRRVRDAREAAALYRALGEAEVYVQGWQTADARDQERLVAATPPASDVTLTFDGTLDLDALATLVGDEHGYLDVSAGGMRLRVWPDHAWVYGDREKPHETDGADAFRIFRERATGGRIHGFLMQGGARSLARLPAFLRACAARLEANLRLAPEVAASLADIAHEVLWWQAGVTHVYLPEGCIAAYHIGAPDPMWAARIDRALSTR